MVDHEIMDALRFKGEALAKRWAAHIRKTPQLRTYNALTDEALITLEKPIFSELGRLLERGLDRSELGGFFVALGKDRMTAGYPISETVLALNLSRQVVIELMESEAMLDNPVKLYQSIGLSSKIAEFYFLGCFYLTKGYLEAIYSQMNATDKVSEALLKKYFKDDFFFKKREE